MNEELRKYVGKCVASVGGEIVAAGRTRLEAYRKAKELYPQKQVTLSYIPRKKETLTFL